MASKSATVAAFVIGDWSGRDVTRALVRLSVIGALIGAAASVHSAEYTASANCGGSQDTESNGTSAGAECGYGITYPYPGFISAFAQADALGLYAAAHGAGYSDGIADASVSDNYFVPSGGPPGTTGSLDFTFYVHGISASPQAMGQVRLTADNPLFPATTPDADIVYEQTINGVATVSATASLAVSYTAGVPNNIEEDLNLYSLAGYIDFSDTVELVGIKAFDSDGNPVSGDITGDGGFDYTKLAASNAAALGLAAPEASTWAMLLIGFGSLGGAMLYRARSRAA